MNAVVNRRHVGVVNQLLVASEKTRDVAACQAGFTNDDHEVRRFGVRAVLVEPFLTKTKIGLNEKTAQISLEDYAIQRKRMTEVVHQGLERGDDPRIVAEAAYQAVTAKSPRLRYPVGQGVALSRLRRFVPAGMFDRSLRKQFQLD